MFKEEDKDQPPSANRKTYSRSVSWSDRSPRKSNYRPQWNSKARACLPPLHPLLTTRPSIEEWPRAGSDDLGVWPNPSTPGARLGSMAPRENMSLDQPPREFEFKKDKLAFFDKECSRILDHIYLGSDVIAKSHEILQRNGITHVLNCVGFVCPEYFKNELVYKTLWLRDSPSEDITSILYDVFDYFEDVREQGGRVLVHCCKGVSRSTSLVIAYLMWKEVQSFEDAFQHVKAARGVTNPNMGFACQLLLCQKRVHAQPVSPTSVLRMYRMAPHSPYDPLHLVPKMLIEPGANRLDSRGSFIIHIPSAIFVWTGKHCFSVMSDNATAAASQVIRYERAQGPIKTIKEGEETSELWDAFGYEKQLADESSPEADTISSPHQCIGQRKVDEYDVDFEIFQKALSGGVVPPFPLSGTESETCLPARENGWSRLKRQFSSGIVKEFISSSRLNYNTTQTCDDLDMIESCKEVEDFFPPDLAMPSSPQCESPPDSFAAYSTSSPGWMKSNFKEVECLARPTDTSLSPSPLFSTLDSFSSRLVNKLKSSSTSPALSPSTSDYSSSFTFSPSSSNWSDLPYFSALTSPSRLEYKDPDLDKVGSAEESECLLHKVTSPPPEETFSAGRIFRETGSCSSCKEPSLYIAERRGNIRPPRMMLPSVDEVSQILENSSKSLPCMEDIMRDVECSTSRHEESFEMDTEEPISDSNDHAAEYELPSRLQDYIACNTFELMSNDMTNRIAQPTDSLFYQWPSMDKMDTPCVILDSRSIYIILVPSVSSEGKNTDVLYIWMGHEVSQNRGHDQSIDDCKCKNSPAHMENIGRSFLAEKGFDTNAQIKIIEEGQEPAHLIEHLSSLRNDFNSGSSKSE
ncbi:unnamed protein product [Fraxinus pennsylvanica]|uniref:Uncharacterized protein n=1 Tax=Fraxinus pennsylvanica TaxID=56036 RepID=A0AAD1YWZ8_9LAMI|nr:unnamed protein product [Fraxinus pennsylvanica]